MRIIFLTESLGSGGAERQLCSLAIGMKHLGHDVNVATYASGDFYRSLLIEENIEHHFLGGKTTFDWMIRIRKFLRNGKQDAVLAFLSSSSNYAELAGSPYRRWGLVVSERLAEPHHRRKGFRLRKYLHQMADYVTTNSHTNRMMLESSVPKLKGRTITIYNMVDLEKFIPNEEIYHSNKLRLIVVARINKQKNVIGLVEALNLLKIHKPSLRIEVDWFGDPDDEAIYNKAWTGIRKYRLEGCFRLLPVRKDIIGEYRSADAIILPSFYEGLPNTICEGMACGRPILLSSVCDAGNLVKEGVNGFLFNPMVPESIAEAIWKFSELTDKERSDMGRSSRALAEIIFNAPNIISRYEAILDASVKGKKLPVEHWVPSIPQTAYSTVEEFGLTV